jgi:hypothetical protein
METSNPSGKPTISVVIVTISGIAGLAVALPGIENQTIANQIELIIVAAKGHVQQEELGTIVNLHSVCLVELPEIINRGRDSAAGVAVANADYVAVHENHTRAEPETYERLLAGFDEDTGAVCPIIYAANSEMMWGRAMYCMAHGHAAPPLRSKTSPFLVLHHSMYRTSFIQKRAERLEFEGEIQDELVASGMALRFIPGTVVWHVNEARPQEVLHDTFFLGRLFGFNRSHKMGMFEKLARAASWPLIVGMAAVRVISEARRSPEASNSFIASLPVYSLAGLAWGTGEALGYLTRQSPRTKQFDLHEFHIRGRLNGRVPAKRWLVEAINKLPPHAP